MISQSKIILYCLKLNVVKIELLNSLIFQKLIKFTNFSILIFDLPIWLLNLSIIFDIKSNPFFKQFINVDNWEINVVLLFEFSI